MRSNRFIAVVLVLGSVMALSSCTPFTKIVGNGETLGKLEGSWVVQYVAGKKLEGVRPELTFDTAKGSLIGFDGCNRLNGTFAFKADLLKAETAPANGLRMPATFKGSLPCADCEGIRYHLDLWPDGVFHLCRTYLGRPGGQDELGRWRRDPGHSAILLYGGREMPLQFEIKDPQTLRLLDIQFDAACSWSITGQVLEFFDKTGASIALFEAVNLR